MADIVKAVAGTKISIKALGSFVGKNLRNQHLVDAKTGGNNGRWFCVDCGELAQHNLDAWNHAEKHTKRTPHRHAWYNLDSGRLEEP